MEIVRGRVRAYYSATHTADVEAVRGPAALLSGLLVVSHCPAGFLTAGREVAVLLWSDVDGVVLGPYGVNADNWILPGDLTLGGQLKSTPPDPVGSQVGGIVRAVFEKTGIADNVLTAVFKITQTNEPGSTDGGAYSVFMHACIGHAAVNNASYVAAKSITAQFSRAMAGTGSGVNSTVTEVVETASAATSAASRDIGTVTIDKSEVSEYEVQVKFQIDLTGSNIATAQVVVMVELVYTGFLTPPVLAAI